MKYVQKYWIVICIVFFIGLFITPAIPFILMGILTLFLATNSILSQNRIAKKGVKAIGRIVSNRYSSGNRYPIIAFRTLANETITGEPVIYTNIDGIGLLLPNNIDNEVEVIYDPSDPKKFILSDERGCNEIGLYLFIVVGLIFIGIGIAAFLGHIHFSS